jgi:hypothetical protein
VVGQLIRLQIINDRVVEAKLDSAGPIIGTELDRAGREAMATLVEGAKLRAPERTGRLRGAIEGFIRRQAGLFVSVEGARGQSLQVGVRIDHLRAPYGVYVERGTGIYAGRTPWTITARDWRHPLPIPTSADGLLYRHSATIQGARPHPFIEESVAANREHVKMLFREAGRRMGHELG